MEKETEKIIDKFRQTRVEKKVSLLNLATEAGISHSRLCCIESKRVTPSLWTASSVPRARLFTRFIQRER